MNVNRCAGKAFTEMCGRGILPFGMMCFRMTESRSYALIGRYILYAFINPLHTGIYENGVVNLIMADDRNRIRQWNHTESTRGWSAIHKSNLQIP